MERNIYISNDKIETEPKYIYNKYNEYLCYDDHLDTYYFENDRKKACRFQGYEDLNAFVHNTLTGIFDLETLLNAKLLITKYV